MTDVAEAGCAGARRHAAANVVAFSDARRRPDRAATAVLITGSRVVVGGVAEAPGRDRDAIRIALFRIANTPGDDDPYGPERPPGPRAA